MNFRNVEGIWTTIGIVSFGPSSCVHNIPSVFTRIQSYLNWIETVMYRNNSIITSTAASLIPWSMTTEAFNASNSINVPNYSILFASLVAAYLSTCAP